MTGGSPGIAGPVKPRPDAPIHLLVERAEVPAEAVAIRCGTVTMTRAELFRTARAWAAVLAREGCGPEVPVAVLLPRGVDALVAVLAVLYAGGAYVPLRCDDSPTRLKAILEDCHRPMVLADDDTATRLDFYSGPITTLDGLRARARLSDALPLPPVVSATSLAFVLYPSDTGQPEGVEGTHGQLVNYALWCRETFPHRGDERHLLHAPLSSPGSLTSIFTPLLAGWPIEIVPDDATIDDLLEKVPVGLLTLTPTNVGKRRTARQVMISGEPLVMTEEFAEWIRSNPSAVLVGHYGSVETHGCFCHWFGSDVPVGEGIPIGRPIDNVRAYIVDRHCDEVPRGTPGELLIAGTSVGRGYHGKPRPTAERWVPDPFGAPGERLLRTGDLARQRTDGTVEILGRVEPRALHVLPDMTEAFPLPRQQEGMTTLVAYLIARTGVVLHPTAVHRMLADELPPPAVPPDK